MTIQQFRFGKAVGSFYYALRIFYPLIYVSFRYIAPKIKFNFSKLLPYLKKYGKIRFKVCFWIDVDA